MRERWKPKVDQVGPLVRPVPIDGTGVGGPTRGQAQGPRWRQSSRGLYVPADTRHHPEQRILEQSVRLGPLGAVTGWAALRLHGAAYFDGEARGAEGSDGAAGPLPVPLQSPDRHLRSDARSMCLLGSLPSEERMMRHGFAVTTPERALFDDMRLSSLRDAVVAMDMAALAELTSIKRMRAFAKGRFDAERVVFPALRLATQDAHSPAEARMRLIWELDAQLPRPLGNRPLFAFDGKFLGVPDLLDVRLGIVGEYDGADHRAKDRRFRDLGREELFRDHGLEYFTLVAGDLHQIESSVGRMLGVVARARSSLRVRDQRWTLTAPPGWVPFAFEEDLDDRLDFRDFLASQRGA